MRRTTPYFQRASEAGYWRSIPLDRLLRMLRAERKRGLAGHWAYDLARHQNMLTVYRERKFGREDVSCR